MIVQAYTSGMPTLPPAKEQSWNSSNNMDNLSTGKMGEQSGQG
jgi:hypothetical protein